VTEEVVIEVESPHGDHQAEEIAEAIADAEIEVAHELQQEAEIEHADETAETALDIAQQALITVPPHEHPEYALVNHPHPEIENRIATLENRVMNIEEHVDFSSHSEEVEEIEPTPEPPSEPEHKRMGFRKGRQ